jgi:hypothetical protein
MAIDVVRNELTTLPVDVMAYLVGLEPETFWTIPSLTETGLCGFRSQEMRSKGEERSTV